ncbi:hypothetical protein CEXT_395741 [Caerostris extrusa]|uniref:Uncharacterized protein n=1 Tax=Caerostris extrusa TaxID=172846 RepID=A0AAV4P160_CAEEX|nr:hypothetical protein CEXT_395741 [Caerostris extrusa]
MHNPFFYAFQRHIQLTPLTESIHLLMISAYAALLTLASPLPKGTPSCSWRESQKEGTPPPTQRVTGRGHEGEGNYFCHLHEERCDFSNMLVSTS